MYIFLSIIGLVAKKIKGEFIMSTNAYIGMELPDGKIKYIYSHWDGYVEKPGVGHKLKNFYTDINKVEELINLGDISVLGKNIGEKHEDYNLARENDWTIAYGRDLDSQDFEAKIVKNYESLPNDMSYVYIFKNGKWYYREDDSKLKKL